ncbi:uncharacterized protein Pyn_02881 [Prunus yedoensis var. nudiflora]|uniref:Uncharacterized protein n=1 Tax=Prunus yedoensis var. nudiflora TaxID=2094558 RepID=A0A314YFC3_PRUYE|nr:uncharacterized protein Pyn_02881 [Prunus yedoensis var. nudiflora]
MKVFCLRLCKDNASLDWRTKNYSLILASVNHKSRCYYLVWISKMAEPARVLDNKVDEVQEDREMEQHEESVASQELPNSVFTAELDLLIVFLSLFSLSTEESLNSVEREPERRIDGAKAIKRLQKKRQEIDEVKPVRRRTQRFQTRIRDSRHGRRV